MAKKQLTLILPGFAPLLSQQINNSIIPTHLAKLIAKADFKANQHSFKRGLFNYFSQDEIIGSDLPILSLMGDDELILRIDPCYLHADRDQLLLFADDLAISAEQSTALIAEIQALLIEFGGIIKQQQPDQWVLHLDKQPDLNLTALPEVIGQGLEHHLPQGQDKQAWLRLWNEIQMKLFNSDINQQRIEQGKLPINGVWFWGAGQFKPKQMTELNVQSQVEIVQQFATRSNCLLKYHNDFIVDDLMANNLWVFDDIEPEEWLQQLDQLEALFQTLWQQIKTAKIKQFELIIPNYGHYHLTAIDCWKFWK